MSSGQRTAKSRLARRFQRAALVGAKRRKGSKVHVAVDTLGQLLALHVTPANEQDREQVETLAQAVQHITGQSVQLAYVDQGYRGFAWAARFRRLARDDERLAQTLAGFHYPAFACLMLHRILPMLTTS